MNTNLLKGEIKARGMTQADISREIGVSLSRFNAKLNNCHGAEFSLAEVRSLKNLLNLSPSQVDIIFFS